MNTECGDFCNKNVVEKIKELEDKIVNLQNSSKARLKQRPDNEMQIFRNIF